ncbi:MAG: phage tail protein [Gemmatimonadaceae bacterium]|nr:phage tail protein [Chitinophagaceae bacterium]
MADSNIESFYQTVNFHFKVDFNFSPRDGIDVRFQSVAGLDVTMETESIKEAGENRFAHELPVRIKATPLTLKRGLLKPSDSKLTDWLKNVFRGERIKPISTVNIALLGEDHQPLVYWTINNVWPRSWKVGELNAEKGEVLIETLELNYNRIILSKS